MKIHLGELAVQSPAFTHGGRIPDQFTRVGQALSPPLRWSGPPDGTRSFALICEDPDAPLTYGFTHWVLYGIPAGVASLEAGADQAFTAGRNTAGQPGYFPVGPPPGHGGHSYYFHVYALDEPPRLPPGLDKAGLLREIDEHIIEQARIVGTFSQS